MNADEIIKLPWLYTQKSIVSAVLFLCLFLEVTDFGIRLKANRFKEKPIEKTSIDEIVKKRGWGAQHIFVPSIQKRGNRV